MLCCIAVFMLTPQTIMGGGPRCSADIFRAAFFKRQGESFAGSKVFCGSSLSVVVKYSKLTVPVRTMSLVLKLAKGIATNDSLHGKYQIPSYNRYTSFTFSSTDSIYYGRLTAFCYSVFSSFFFFWSTSVCHSVIFVALMISGHIFTRMRVFAFWGLQRSHKNYFFKILGCINIFHVCKGRNL